MKRTKLILGYLALLLMTSCEDRSQEKISNEERVSVLGEKIGIQFPQNATLLNEIADSNRLETHTHYAWGLKSTKAFEIPERDEDFSDFPVETAVPFVEMISGGIRIDKPTTAVSGHWLNDGYEYRFVLVRAVDAEYLAIEQYRQ
ncbi:hypothetical protein SAMN02745166_02465 [Prosthecobacter debontii]|uniref:Lipoprotein n=1 Tax=Prosthecobacter debontii TaxID=48467 RepID=A0A1T4Y4L8_9BACT|nr:hypothetical protein [Prosthecobacter debontii]SKA96762.1 hypothetical protein SAMN02745166_02465 [Prosthecobacter debontii]